MIDELLQPLEPTFPREIQGLYAGMTCPVFDDCRRTSDRPGLVTKKTHLCFACYELGGLAASLMSQTGVLFGA
jgi:hypothetical protein